jgi:hypothetical protein
MSWSLAQWASWLGHNGYFHNIRYYSSEMLWDNVVRLMEDYSHSARSLVDGYSHGYDPRRTC